MEPKFNPKERSNFDWKLTYKIPNFVNDSKNLINHLDKNNSTQNSGYLPDQNSNNFKISMEDKKKKIAKSLKKKAKRTKKRLEKTLAKDFTLHRDNIAYERKNNFSKTQKRSLNQPSNAEKIIPSDLRCNSSNDKMYNKFASNPSNLKIKPILAAIFLKKIDKHSSNFI